MVASGTDGAANGTGNDGGANRWDGSGDVGGIPIVGQSGGTGTADSGSGTGSGKRRGRPPGSKNGTGGTGAEKASAANLKPQNIAPYIFAFHMMLASKLPEMMLSQKEADELALAICNYLRHSGGAVSQRNLDLMALIAALLMIEGTRLVAVVTRTKREKRVQASAATGVSNVTMFDPNYPVPGAFG